MHLHAVAAVLLRRPGIEGEQRLDLFLQVRVLRLHAGRKLAAEPFRIPGVQGGEEGVCRLVVEVPLVAHVGAVLLEAHALDPAALDLVPRRAQERPRRRAAREQHQQRRDPQRGEEALYRHCTRLGSKRSCGAAFSAG